MQTEVVLQALKEDGCVQGRGWARCLQSHRELD